MQTRPSPPVDGGRPVFVGSGRRARVLRIGGSCLGLVLVLWVGLAAAALLGADWVPQVRLPAVGPVVPGPGDDDAPVAGDDKLGEGPQETPSTTTAPASVDGSEPTAPATTGSAPAATPEPSDGDLRVPTTTVDLADPVGAAPPTSAPIAPSTTPAPSSTVPAVPPSTSAPAPSSTVPPARPAAPPGQEVATAHGGSGSGAAGRSG